MSDHLKPAILGGPKAVSLAPPHYSWPPITPAIEAAVIRQLHTAISIYDRSGIFEEFENEFAEFHHAKHALLCNSGTQAIHSMFIAAGFGEGDEVICPTYTFFATVTPLLHTGAKPVLCDCDENGNIDPAQIIANITNRTRGIVVTHMWGIPCQMDEIRRIALEHDLLLMEDCSHAHGARFNGQPVGSFGDMAAWSIQGAKNISGGEGGVVATSNDDFYSRMLLLGHYNKRCKQEISDEHPLFGYGTTGMGMKYRAHPLAVAIARELLNKLDIHLAKRREFADLMKEAFAPLDGVRLTPGMVDEMIDPGWYAFVFQFDSQELHGLSVSQFVAAAEAEGLVEIDRPGSTCPLNLLPLFQHPEALFPRYRGESGFSYEKGQFPNAEKFYARAVKLPVWAMEQDRTLVQQYIKGIEKTVASASRLLTIS